MTVLDRVKTTIADAVSAVTGVRGTLGEIDRNIEAQKQRREELLALPIHPDDHVARVLTAVDQRVAHFKRRFAGLAATAAARPADLKGDVWARTIENYLMLAPTLEGQPMTMKDLEAGLCFVFRDQIKAALEVEIRDIDHKGHGPTAAQRAKEVEKIDQELIKLTADRLQILDALTELRREGGSD